MDLKLVRDLYEEDGIYGTYYNPDGVAIATTLEHAYADGFGGWVAKLAAGVYTCVRHAPNHLPYETYLVENTPDFHGQPVTGLLAGHVGNYNHDSDGCVLIGGERLRPMIIMSKIAFHNFMDLQRGEAGFTLTVENQNDPA